MRFQFLIRHSGLVRLPNLECSKFRPTLLISPKHIKTNWCWKVRFVDWIKLSKALLHLLKQICCWIDSTALALYWGKSVQNWVQNLANDMFLQTIHNKSRIYEKFCIFDWDIWKFYFCHKQINLPQDIKMNYKNRPITVQICLTFKVNKNLFVSKRYMTYYCVLTRTVTWFKYMWKAYKIINLRKA